MSTWHLLDGTKVRYENPMRGEHPRQRWYNPQGALFIAERAYPFLTTGSFLKIAGSIRSEGELILAGWRRLVEPRRRNLREES